MSDVSMTPACSRSQPVKPSGYRASMVSSSTKSQYDKSWIFTSRMPFSRAFSSASSAPSKMNW